MAHQYCIRCGAKNIYESTKPKFCSGCGDPFNTTVSKSTVIDEDFDETEESYDDKLHINTSSLRRGWKAQVDNVQRDTIRDLFSNPAPPSEKRTRPRPKSLGDNAAQSTMAECSHVQGSKEIGK